MARVATSTSAGPKIFATSATFTQSAMQFMTPPNPTDLKPFKKKGKLIVVHGAADLVFSSDDTSPRRIQMSSPKAVRPHARGHFAPARSERSSRAEGRSRERQQLLLSVSRAEAMPRPAQLRLRRGFLRGAGGRKLELQSSGCADGAACRECRVGPGAFALGPLTDPDLEISTIRLRLDPS